MENFIFQNKTKIIFGKDSELRVGEEIKKYSNKILFHYGSERIKNSGLYDTVVKSLKTAGVEYIELAGVVPNPRLDLVKKGIEICRNNNISFILAVGGGSVIDSAKAISVGIPYKGDVWDFFKGNTIPEKIVPIGTIVTIPAAGSESSGSTVITDELGGRKLALKNDMLRPRFAIMNPELTMTLPDYQTKCGAVDMLSHVLERYFTKTKYVNFTDRLCEATMKSIIENTKLVLQEPNNYNYRAELMWASTIAHNGLLNTGRVGDWATHLIEHEISAVNDIAHGAGLAIMFPAWMKYVYKKDIPRFVKFAQRVFNIEPDYTNLEKTALDGIIALKKFYKEIAMPTSLREISMEQNQFEDMATKATNNGPIGEFVKLHKKDVIEIYKLAW